MKEVQTDEIQTWFIGCDAAPMAGFAVRLEDRQVDPGEAVAKAGAPDNVCDVEYASVLQRRESVHDATDLRDALNACSREIFRLDTDQWRTLREHPPARSAAHGRADREQMMEHDAEQEPRQAHSRRQPVDAERYVPCIAARHPGRMIARHVERDFGARVARTGEEHAAGLQLPRIAVLARVHLQDVSAQIVRERRHAWRLVARHRDDDVVRFEAIRAGFDQISAAGAGETIDAGLATNRQLKPARVVFEVIRHLIFRWKRKRQTRKLHPDEAVEQGWREQAKRIPPLAPAVAHVCTGVKDDE